MRKKNSTKFKSFKIAIIGLGYVGLPLATEFGKKFLTIGFDVDKKRIKELKMSFDKTEEVLKRNISQPNLTYTCNENDLLDSNIYIITVPTPVDENKNPDLEYLKSASKLVAKYLKLGDIVIYESTVYPGATEEVCVPILENFSNLVFNKDFFCGYSPERINPGDKQHKITDIVKITSGSTKEISKIVDNLYSEIITAGTFVAKNIKTAEAAKVIENTQRDVNIALINELSIIFDKIGIDTMEVLDAAKTKWNFLPFEPGLVGGHCIGVDPYYLTHKSIELGYKPEMILSGRKINDLMPHYIASKVCLLMKEKKIDLKNAKVLIMGFSFKENCTDFRNTKVVDLFKNIKENVSSVDIFDPKVNLKEVSDTFKIKLLKKIPKKKYDAVIFAVPHKEFSKYAVKQLKEFTKSNSIIFDVKGSLPLGEIDGRL